MAAPPAPEYPAGTSTPLQYNQPPKAQKAPESVKHGLFLRSKVQHSTVMYSYGHTYEATRHGRWGTRLPMLAYQSCGYTLFDVKDMLTYGVCTSRYVHMVR